LQTKYLVFLGDCAAKAVVVGVEKTIPHPKYNKPGREVEFNKFKCTVTPVLVFLIPRKVVH
jgi:ribosomal protein S17